MNPDKKMEDKKIGAGCSCHQSSCQNSDLEAQLQRNENLHGESRLFHLLVFCVWAVIAFYDRAAMELRVWLDPLRRWFVWRRECSWCPPRRSLCTGHWRRRWLGGNPWARQITHGVCKRCEEKFLADAAIFNGIGGASVPASRGSSVASPHQPQFSHEPATDELSIRATASSAASDPNSNTGRTLPATNSRPSPAGS